MYASGDYESIYGLRFFIAYLWDLHIKGQLQAVNNVAVPLFIRTSSIDRFIH